MLTDIILNYYFQSDVQLVAFAPLMPFFDKVKKSTEVYQEKGTLLPKLHLDSKLIDKICGALSLSLKKFPEEIGEETLNQLFGDKKKEVGINEANARSCSRTSRRARSRKAWSSSTA